MTSRVSISVFAQARLEGEWFALPPAIVAALVDPKVTTVAEWIRAAGGEYPRGCRGRALELPHRPRELLDVLTTEEAQLGEEIARKREILRRLHAEAEEALADLEEIRDEIREEEAVLEFGSWRYYDYDDEPDEVDLGPPLELADVTVPLPPAGPHEAEVHPAPSA